MKSTIKCLVDIFMTVLLLFLMGYQFWGDKAHEWMGIGLFVLFILHHILNRQWYKVLFKGRYTPLRTIQTVVDVLLLVFMLLLMYSGIVLAQYTFRLPLMGHILTARRLHILGSYWGFLLMSVHLGLHWGMLLGRVKKVLRLESSPQNSALLFVLGAGVSLYGVVVFFKRNFLTYLLLKSEFVYLDYSEPVVLFYTDYLALMGLCIFIGHYGTKMLGKFYKRKGASA